MENQLTLIDICKSIRDAVLTKASEVTVYSSWSAEFGYEEIVNFPRPPQKYQMVPLYRS
ncbi:hypothetical protein ALHIDCOG_00187 [Klebsiella phage CPRSB]|nr:hypothetical protein ALHIDCOG_00187 [Klebsiella phage CPRSB]